MSDRNIYVLSGPMGSGKSYYFGVLAEWPEIKNVHSLVFSKDDIYWQYFGKRDGFEHTHEGHLAMFHAMTDAERVYGNEILRVEVERAILVNRVRSVLLDLSMSSSKVHRRPFLEMIQKTECLLQEIEKQKAEKQGPFLQDHLPKVKLFVVLFYCDFASIEKIMSCRYPSCRGELPPPLLKSMSFFEVPTEYLFLALDTSDKSFSADKERRKKMRDFFAGKISDEELEISAEEARRCIMQVKKEIGIV